MLQYLLLQITLKLNCPDKASETHYILNPTITCKSSITYIETPQYNYYIFRNITLEKAYALCLNLSSFNDSLPILNHNVTSVASNSDA